MTETTSSPEKVGEVQAAAPVTETCGICGDDYDPRYSRTGICFTCSVHAVCACGDPPDR